MVAIVVWDVCMLNVLKVQRGDETQRQSQKVLSTSLHDGNRLLLHFESLEIDSFI